MNNVILSGRVANVTVNESNTRMNIRLIHNFGGEVEPISPEFVAFKNKKGAWPAGVEGLKKGDNVIISAFQRPNNFTNAEGEKKYRTRNIIKRVEANTENKSVNDVEINGRLAADASVNEAGTRCEIRLIHNFGGDNEPLGLTFFSLKGKNNELVGSGLKKGDKVVVKAFQRSNNYTNAEGEKKYRTQLLLKSVTEDVKPEEESQKEDAIDAEEVMNLG